VNTGRGGAGCISFFRENYGSSMYLHKFPKFFKMINAKLLYLGIPDGGNGGNGGDVYFRSTARLSSLFDLRRAHFLGNDGKAGRVSNNEEK
jgi:GTP-binding protein